MSEKRPETDREILSRSKKFELPMAEVSLGTPLNLEKFSCFGQAYGRVDMNYHKLYKLFKDMRSKKPKRSFWISGSRREGSNSCNRQRTIHDYRFH
ncbi:MAG: hypothetical protein Ct9H90mP27_3150 [Gammaproteobacteria bacterium]|nr:MAG: hypothetical protein Ct9H90mP27_3150 [Gammaproteobacteria bacterium]